MFKLSISHKINGATVDSETWKRKLVENARNAALERLKEGIQAISCQEHLQSPTVEILGNGNLRIGACCQGLLDAANARARSK